MGVDFIRSKRQQHTKAWSRQFFGRTMDLFAGSGGTAREVFRATTEAGHVLRPGDQVLVRRMMNGGVAVTRDICQVATVEAPSPGLLDVLDQHEGVMPGRVYQNLDAVGVTDIEYEV